MFKKFKCSIVFTLIISVALGLVLAIGTRYGYKIYNVFFTKNIIEVQPVKKLPGNIEMAIPKTEEYYPSVKKNTAYSGFPLSAYSRCSSNKFIDANSNHLGMKCTGYRYGEWTILFNWIIWSVIFYMLIRLFTHRCEGDRDKYN